MADTHRDCVAIVTGAGRGLGLAMATGLLRAGAQVAAVEIDSSALEALQKAAGAGERLLLLKADVTREEEVRDIVAKTLARFGHVDVLVNNAGLNLETVDPAGGKRAPTFRDLAPRISAASSRSMPSRRSSSRALRSSRWRRKSGAASSA